MSGRFFFHALIAMVVVFLVGQGSTGTEPIRDCIRNQTWSLCGRMCEPTCSNPKPNTMFCPRLECTKFIAACRCDKGYLRRKDDACVLPKDCC